MAKLIAAANLRYCILCDRYRDPLSVIEKSFQPFVSIDRFGFLNHYSPFDFAEKQDELPSYSDRKFSDIIDEVATEIVATGKPAYIPFSSGVDSTTILVALLRNGLPKDKLTAIYFPQEHVAYPFAFEWLQKEGIKVVKTQNVFAYTDKVRDSLVIPGWCADILFGYTWHQVKPSLYNEPWIEALDTAMRLRGVSVSQRSLSILKDVYDDYASKFGLKLEKFCEFAWLQAFGLRWNYWENAQKLRCTSQEARDCVFTFFADRRFQDWSFSNFGNLSKEDVFSNNAKYKLLLKQYIYEYWKDEGIFTVGKSHGRLTNEDLSKSITVLDTDGYHKFSIPNGNVARLNELVAQNYLKEEFRE